MKLSFAPKALALAVALAAVVVGPARAADPSPAAKALALQLITDVGLRGSVEGLPPLLLSEIELNIAKVHPELANPLKEAATAIIPEFVHSSDNVVGDIAYVLATKMTEQEMRDSITFFESPVGKKYLATQPVLLREFSAATGVWREDLANTMLTRLHEEMKKKGLDF